MSRQGVTNRKYGRVRAAVATLGVLTVLGMLLPGAAQAGAAEVRAAGIVAAAPAQPAEAPSMDEQCAVGDIESSIGPAVVDSATGEGRAQLVISARWAAVRCAVGAYPDRVAFTDAEGTALRTSVTRLDSAGNVVGDAAEGETEPMTLDVEHSLAIELRWHGADIGSAQGSPAVRPAFLHLWLPGLEGPVGGRWEHGPVYNTG